MTLQRRLSGMERDLAAIQAKVNSADVPYQTVKLNKKMNVVQVKYKNRVKYTV